MFHSYTNQVKTNHYIKGGSRNIKSVTKKKDYHIPFKERKKCYYYTQGTCIFRNHCKNLHEVRRCRYFFESTCWFGSRCSNSHEIQQQSYDPAPVDSITVQSNQIKAKEEKRKRNKWLDKKSKFLFRELKKVNQEIMQLKKIVQNLTVGTKDVKENRMEQQQQQQGMKPEQKQQQQEQQKQQQQEQQKQQQQKMHKQRQLMIQQYHQKMAMKKEKLDDQQQQMTEKQQVQMHKQQQIMIQQHHQKRVVSNECETSAADKTPTEEPERMEEDTEDADTANFMEQPSNMKKIFPSFSENLKKHYSNNN